MAPDWVGDCVASQLKLLLMELHSTHCEGMMEKVSVVVDPTSTRAVVAKTRIEKGGITLVPVTPHVQCLKRKDKNPKNAVDLCAVADDGSIDLKFFANPIFKKGKADGPKADQFIAPFWYVESTTDPGAANCELITKTITIPGDHWHSGEYKVCVIKSCKVIAAGVHLAFFRPNNVAKYPSLNTITDGAKRHRTH